MKRDLSGLTNKQFDLIVVGGGIFGVCVAWDATLRGLSVALVEQGDFGHATSAHHFKMVHGGIRYLQHADLYRVRESTIERSALLRIAPHLVYPLPIAIPTFGHGLKGKEILTAALWLYDRLTFDRNHGIDDPLRQIPPGRIISQAECLEMFPGLADQGPTGAAVFHDGQMYNPPRLTLAYLKSAVERGAVAANYVEATGFIQQQGGVVGIRGRDLLDDNPLEIRGRVVLNAAGPWAERLLRQQLGLEMNPQPVFSRDAYFIVNRRLIGDHALAVQGETGDPDALLSRGKRHLFIVPWRQDYTLIGVWHVVHHGAPDDFTVTEAELQEFLDEINGAYPPLELGLEDISMWSAGLTLFGENKPGAKNLSYGKRSMLIDHAKTHGVDGLLSLVGVRFTTSRGMAAKAVDQVYKKLRQKAPKSETATTPLFGGQIEDFDSFLQHATRRRLASVSADVMPSLAHNYGSGYREVMDYVKTEPGLAGTVGTSDVLRAQIIYAVREEMARKLGDVVFRRTDLGTGGHPGDDALRTCADLMADELGWDGRRIRCELEAVRDVFPGYAGAHPEALSLV